MLIFTALIWLGWGYKTLESVLFKRIKRKSTKNGRRRQIYQVNETHVSGKNMKISRKISLFNCKAFFVTAEIVTELWNLAKYNEVEMLNCTWIMFFCEAFFLWRNFWEKFQWQTIGRPHSVNKPTTFEIHYGDLLIFKRGGFDCLNEFIPELPRH